MIEEGVGLTTPTRGVTPPRGHKARPKLTLSSMITTHTLPNPLTTLIGLSTTLTSLCEGKELVEQVAGKCSLPTLCLVRIGERDHMIECERAAVIACVLELQCARLSVSGGVTTLSRE